MFALTYILGNGSEDLRTLLNFGAMSKLHIIEGGQVFRLFTSAFLHIGVMHLLLNMWALKAVGTQVENLFGKKRFLIIYFGGTLVASLVSLVFMDMQTISAGASGAIFALFGALLYFGYNYRAYLGNVMIRQIMPVIAINLFIGFMVPGINNAAHLGGLVGGLLFSYAVGLKNKTNKQERINGIIAVIMILAILAYLIFNQ